jgi:carbamoyltransferase
VEDNDCESPFMLRTSAFRDDRAELVSAVVHVDGSARVQTVRETVEPRLHGLLQRFQDLTGVPMVLNTSLNGSRQPIVELRRTPSGRLPSSASTFWS